MIIIMLSSNLLYRFKVVSEQQCLMQVQHTQFCVTIWEAFPSAFKGPDYGTRFEPEDRENAPPQDANTSAPVQGTSVTELVSG